MLERLQHGPVTRFKMGREVNGEVIYWCAAYLVDGLLIDSGCVHTAPELLEAVRPSGVKRVVNTHSHEDHIGGNALLAAELGVELLAPAGGLDYIAGNAPPIYPYQEMLWGKAPASRPAPLGELVNTPSYRFEVVPTPGHSSDSVVLWEPHEGWAFVGDLWLVPKPKTSRDFENNRQTMASLRKLRDLGPETLFTGLGDVVSGGVAALGRTIAWLEEQQGRIEYLAAQGVEPAEMVQRLYGGESVMHAFTQGQFCYENFVRSFLKGTGN
ncbi:MAG: MBL fold metallo-hydrolase [Desulfarculaceae bacterium]|nr:MBL fold metallo-hydrolase [Desulfarculaceae bacterium]